MSTVIPASGMALQHFQFQRTKHLSSSLASDFIQLWSNSKLIDFKLKSEDVLNCHKVVLAAGCPLLKAMICSEMTEAAHKVRLDNIPSVILQTVLDYIFTGKATVPQNQLIDTIKASDYFQLLELKMNCLQEAVTILKMGNILSWFQFS